MTFSFFSLVGIASKKRCDPNKLKSRGIAKRPIKKASQGAPYL
ncbi:hypothetical protein BN938_1852 [Mucinivorans hirudinis]|uniref:Uncharacterized protein n=1 Tax=Mucinivorans hirudinis TaxID=1433126 RepID=A0A060R8V0_9BACT|nr:hypothetical protein BN938_1852 [Mucinivorans hirudinis]